MSNLPPYNITVVPSSGTHITMDDINNAIRNYGNYKTARYFFIQLETLNTYMNYSEIEIYDPSGNNIALDLDTTNYAQSTNYTNNTYPASNAFNGFTTDFQHTWKSTGNREWLGIDLNSNKQIAGIYINSRANSYENSVYADFISLNSVSLNRTYPFRIYLYTKDEYINGGGTFADGGTGPLDYNNYHIRYTGDSRNNNDVITKLRGGTVLGPKGTNEYLEFQYGIKLCQDNTTNDDYTYDISLVYPTEYFYNKSIVDIDYGVNPNINLPPYNITFTPISGTLLTESDISDAILKYNDYKVAQYFFIQLDTKGSHMNYAEIEIYDPSGNNIALNLNTTNYAQSSINANDAAFKAFDGNIINYQHTDQATNRLEWLGVNLGSDQKIAGIRIYGRNGEWGTNDYSARVFPFRIFLYTSTEYTSTEYTRTFANGWDSPPGTGPLNFEKYHLHSSEATTRITRDDQHIFYFGIEAKLGSQYNIVTNRNILLKNPLIQKVDTIINDLPPYKITVTPSVTRYHEARYFFIQLETENTVMNYAEIEIYDENGTNIALNLGTTSYVQSSLYNNNTANGAYKAFDNNTGNYQFTSSSTNIREWIGVNLGSNQKISRIDVYSRINNSPRDYTEGGLEYPRVAPFRIFFYTSDEYTGTFANGYDSTPGTGPLDYTNYTLHTNDADVNETITNGTQQYFYFDLLQTKIRPRDIDRAIANYDTTVGFKEARYFFIQLETVNTAMNYTEIEIYDENGTNIAISANNTDVSYAQSSLYLNDDYRASKAFDGNITNYHHTGIATNRREWLGIDLSGNKKIAGIRVYGRSGVDYVNDGSNYARAAPFRIFLYTSDEYTGTFANGYDSTPGTGPLDYNTYHLRSSKDQFVNGPSNMDVTGSIHPDSEVSYWYFGIEAQIGNAKHEVHCVPSNIETYNKAIADVEYVNYSGHGNYYHMDVSMHYSDISYGVYLPTVTFTNSGGNNGRFTNTMRTTQLAEQGFTGFYEADFANGITVIDQNAFLHDKKVCVVTINGMTDICGNAFKGCSNLRAVTLHTAVDSSYNYTLKNIHDSVFENCTALKQIFIPDSVTSIPNSAFKGCTSLEVAVMGYGIPRSVNGSIGASAFEDCTSLTYFYIPETVTSVGANAFNNCSSLESLYIDDSVSIGSDASNAFTNISSSCIVYVENDAYPDSYFPNSYNIRRFTVVTVNTSSSTLSHTDVNTDCSNATIDTSAYWKAKCTGSFSTFGENVFNANNISYDNLVSISIQSSNVLAIDDQCFINLPVFQGLYIPSNIIWIYGDNDSVKDNERIVVNCNECRQISFEQNCIDINFQDVTNSDKYTFVENGNLRAIILPHRLTKIIGYMCQNNTKLQLMNIFQKNAKTEIAAFYRYNHFQNANLEEIHLFVNSTELYDNINTTNNLFLDCNNLKRIYIYNNHNTPQIQIYNNGGDKGKARNANVFYVIKDSTANTIYNHSGWNLHTIFKTSVTTISAGTYYSYQSLKTITFEHNTSSNGSSLAIQGDGIGAFSKTYIADGANHIKWNNRVITFPNQNDPSTYGIFENCNQLTSFYIPDQFSEIPARFLSMYNSNGNGTKRSYGKLSKIYWGKNPSVKRIGRYSLEYLKIYKLHIPASVAVIDTRPLLRTYNLMKVTFGAGSRLKRADEGILGANPSSSMEIVPHLSELVLPTSLITLGKHALHNSVGRGYIENLIIPSSVDYLDENIVWSYDGSILYRPKIGNIYIPNSITNLPGPRRHNNFTNNGLHDGSGIRSIGTTRFFMPSHLYPYDSTYFSRSGTYAAFDVIPYNFVTFNDKNNIITSISHQTYYHAEIGNSITTVGNGTNELIGNRRGDLLISVNFPRSVVTINAKAFKDCIGLTYVTFNERSKITEIKNNSFENCTNIHDIKLPYKLSTIGANAFKGCSNLRTIEIPYSVSSIGDGAFIDCYNLQQVSLHDVLFNDISNNLNNIFETENIKVIPTVEFTTTTLTSDDYKTTLKNNNVYPGSVYYPKFSDSVTSIVPAVYADFKELTLYIKHLDRRFKTTGPAKIITKNNVYFPYIAAAWSKDKIYTTANTATNDLPIYRSIPDLNVYNTLSSSYSIYKKDDYFQITPGFQIVGFQIPYDNLGGVIYGENSDTTFIGDASRNIPLLIDAVTPNTTSAVLVFYNNQIIDEIEYVD